MLTLQNEITKAANAFWKEVSSGLSKPIEGRGCSLKAVVLDGVPPHGGLKVILTEDSGKAKDTITVMIEIDSTEATLTWESGTAFSGGKVLPFASVTSLQVITLLTPKLREVCGILRAQAKPPR